MLLDFAMGNAIRKLWVFACLTWLLSAATLRAADDFEIPPPGKSEVGVKYLLVSEMKGTLSYTIRIDGKVTDQVLQKRAWAFQGDVEVLAVNGVGKPDELYVTIRVITATEAPTNRPVAVLQPGTLVMVRRKDGATEYTIKGVEVSPVVREALANFIRLSSSTSEDDGDLYGTKERKKVGETWPVSKEAILRTLTGGEYILDKESVKGTNRLESANLWAICIDTSIEAQNVRWNEVESNPALKDMKAKESKLQFRFSQCIPNPKGAEASKKESFTAKLAFSYKGEMVMPDGSKAEMDQNFTMESSRRHVYR